MMLTKVRGAARGVGRRAAWPVRNLRMMWKLLIPSIVLVLLVGTTGAYWTVRFLTSKAQVNLESDLVRRSVDTDVFLRDQSLYLLESIRFAANIQGVAEAIAGHDAAAASRLLDGVVVVRPKLDLLTALDASGAPLVVTQPPSGSALGADPGPVSWTDSAFVSEVMSGASNGDKRAGFVSTGSHELLALAGPVRTASGPAAGVIVVAMDVHALVRDAQSVLGAPVALYDGSGTLVSASSSASRPAAPALHGHPIRRREQVGTHRMETAYSDVDLQGGLRATLAVSVPADPVFAPVRGAGARLVVVLVAAMVAGVLLAGALSRLVLGQVNLLVEANRRLGQGDLSARVHVLGNDELGELATGLNQMAEQLEASYSELEMRVEERTEELRRLHQARSEFFAAIGHEFRTPLFAIKGHADLMLDPDFAPRGTKWVHEFGTVIQEAAGDLLARVDEILDLARSSSGRMELDLADVRVGDVVRELQGQIVALARRAELSVSVDVTDGEAIVRADATRLRQIIANLASNAVKYTPAGGAVSITVLATPRDVVLRVRDSGVGIPDDVGPLIFEPFYQVKGTRAQHGESSSGLGLALTKRLVDVHGGTIEFHSPPAAGTTFTVHFPRVRAEHRDSASGVAGRSARPLRSPSRARRAPRPLTARNAGDARA